jgi:signal peptidase I
MKDVPDERKKSADAPTPRTLSERQRAAKAEGESVVSSDDAAPERSHSLWREYFESAIVTAVMALFFITFVGQAAAVPSASMENTILVGDHFLINKFIFAPGPHVPFLPQREIRRGDIIVFKYPSDLDTSAEIVQYQTFFIKRVIGLPGETVEVSGADILINGKPLSEHRIVASDSHLGNDMAELKKLSVPARQTSEPYSVYYSPDTVASTGDPRSRPFGYPYADQGQPFKVPEGQYFVMGDNRDNSKDSRYWGCVPRELVVGRALFVIWSYDESANTNDNFLVKFFKNTRWRRTGTLIK